MRFRVSFGRRFPLAVVSAFLLVLMTGCTTRTFRVDAIKNPDVAASGMAFEVENANPELEDSDPRVKRAADYVRTALSAKGLYEAPEAVPADMKVEVDFGSEAPKREIVRHEEPVYRLIREPGYFVTETYVDEQGRTRTIRRYVPGEEREVFIGWREVIFVVMVYPKYLRITAREVPADGSDHVPRELWSVYVTNEDDEKDMEKSLPMLVAAAMDAIDQNASSQRTVTMKEDDDRVVFIKKGM